MAKAKKGGKKAVKNIKVSPMKAKSVKGGVKIDFHK